MSDFSVAIVGGGLVGSMNACFFAKRGFRVDLYEYRPDIRQTEHVRGRSINLALSVRGLSALRAIGLENKVLEHGIPMYGRMVHDRKGSKRIVPYGTNNQVPYQRQCHTDLGLTFLGEPETSADERVTSEADADFVVGCDGAFSTVRRHMLKEAMFDYSQRYIEHGYVELYMPPDEHGQFAMEANYLHIWPRGDFMLIALPNQDCSFTVTLFMPFFKFEVLDAAGDADGVVRFFEDTFPDALRLIGRTRLMTDFASVKPSHLLTIKCNPYHVRDRSVLMGDAAHAMVPFYGQGMNAGFEDCLIFDELMSSYDGDIGAVLKAFTNDRNPDAEAICDLALYNYLEMRYLVTTVSFRLRKQLDSFLNWCFPSAWNPLYTMVTFSRTHYVTCVARRHWQDKVGNEAGKV